MVRAGCRPRLADGGFLLLHRTFTELYRMAQNDDGEYGRSVSVFRVTKLSEDEYREEPGAVTPFLSASGSGWNAAGMHHIDLIKTGDGWIATVDGRSK